MSYPPPPWAYVKHVKLIDELVCVSCLGLILPPAPRTVSPPTPSHSGLGNLQHAVIDGRVTLLYIWVIDLCVAARHRSIWQAQNQCHHVWQVNRKVKLKERSDNPHKPCEMFLWWTVQHFVYEGCMTRQCDLWGGNTTRHVRERMTTQCWASIHHVSQHPVSAGPSCLIL